MKRQPTAGALSKVQSELPAWQEHNFPGRPAWQPLVGMQEELGELAHAFLKKSQRIRTSELHDEDMKDALGDLLVYACDFANAVGIDLEDTLYSVWNAVRDRDWKADPDKGATPSDPPPDPSDPPGPPSDP